MKVSSLWSMFNKCVSKVVLPGHGPFAAPRRTPAGRPFGRRSGWSPVLCLALSRRVVGLSLMARPDTHAAKVAIVSPPAVCIYLSIPPPSKLRLVAVSKPHRAGSRRKCSLGANTFSNQDARDIDQRICQMGILKTKRALAKPPLLMS